MFNVIIARHFPDFLEFPSASQCCILGTFRRATEAACGSTTCRFLWHFHFRNFPTCMRCFSCPYKSLRSPLSMLLWFNNCHPPPMQQLQLQVCFGKFLALRKMHEVFRESQMERREGKREHFQTDENMDGFPFIYKCNGFFLDWFVPHCAYTLFLISTRLPAALPRRFFWNSLFFSNSRFNDIDFIDNFTDVYLYV